MTNIQEVTCYSCIQRDTFQIYVPQTLKKKNQNHLAPLEDSQHRIQVLDINPNLITQDDKTTKSKVQF